MANANSIIYTGLRLNNIDVDPNTALDDILELIDTAIGSGAGSSPNYSGYNLYCIVQTDGSTHPTNTQNFAEGISKIVCQLSTDFEDFVDNTYTDAITELTDGLNTIQLPELTYSPFSIVDTDTYIQVWNKSFTGFTAIINSIKPNSANWSDLGISTPTSIVAAFNSLIAYEETQDTETATKQDSLGTFDTSSIGGTTGVAPITTINALISYAAALPEYDSSNITFDCITPGGDLESDIQSIINKVELIAEDALMDVDTGLTKTQVSSCNGYSVGIDDTWEGLYKVAVDQTDAAAGDGGFLEDKIESTDSTVTITNTGSTLNLSVPASASVNKVKVNSGATAQFLVDALPSTGGDWGIYLTATVSGNQLLLSPTVNNPSLFAMNLLAVISQDEDLKVQFCSLINSCSTCSCSPATDLTLSIIA